jgi:dipicolinate synthase subunit B
MEKIGFGLTSSFCCIDKVLEKIIELKNMGYDIVPITSPEVVECDTRFGKGLDFKEKIENAAQQKIVSSMIEAEKFGSKEPLDAVVVAPATGNFIGCLANGITSKTVNMAVKATLRNNKPIIIGVSTNDGLGMNGINIMKLLNTKNIYFVPFGQDDYENKPNSLVAHYDLIIPTLEAALNGKQLQPILQEYQPAKTLVKKINK